MGTLGQVSWGPVVADTDLGAELERRCLEIEARLTRFRPGSEVCRLEDEWHEVSPDCAVVLAAARDLQEATGGWFSALLADQVRAWEKVAAPDASGAPGGCRPGGAARRRIEVDGHRARIVAGAHVTPAGPAPACPGPVPAPADSVPGSPGPVDLGAIAKGYAADVLRDLAVRLGAADVLVSLGSSSISVAGRPARIGLASPWLGWDQFGVLTLESGALSVSADPGTVIGPAPRHSHVLDPSSGAPAVTDLCEAIVCGPDAMVCEAWSTAFLAMGLERALEADQHHPGFASVFMTVDGRVLADPALRITAAAGVQKWLKCRRHAMR